MAVHPLWQGKQARFAEAIPKFTNVSEVVAFAQTHGESGFNHRAKADPGQIEVKLRLLAERFPDFRLADSPFEDSPLSMPGTCCFVGDRRLSNVFFWHLNAYLAVSRWLVAIPWRILEIGGGLGELARLFKLAQPWLNYTLVDLPGSLYFAEVYLRAHFPGASFTYSDGNDPVWDADFTFVPAGFTPTVRGAYDYVAVSQGSFQEMPPETVGAYLYSLRRVGARSLYSLNYKGTLAEPLDGWEVVHRELDVPLIVQDCSVNEELCLRSRA